MLGLRATGEFPRYQSPKDSVSPKSVRKVPRNPDAVSHADAFQFPFENFTGFPTEWERWATWIKSTCWSYCTRFEMAGMKRRLAMTAKVRSDIG